MTKTQMSKETQLTLDQDFGERREATDIVFRFSRDELVTFFRFLDEFREVPILAEAFGLTAEDAAAIRSSWAGTLREGCSAEERASGGMGSGGGAAQRRGAGVSVNGVARPRGLRVLRLEEVALADDGAR